MDRGIFALIPEERLRDVLGTLHAVVGLPIQLIDGQGSLLLKFGETTSYCRLIKMHIFTKVECFELHRRAGERAMKLAEAYGLEGTRVDSMDKFTQAFAKAYAEGKPCIIECMLDINEMVAPMVAPGSPIDSFCLN